MYFIALLAVLSSLSLYVFAALQPGKSRVLDVIVSVGWIDLYQVFLSSTRTCDEDFSYESSSIFKLGYDKIHLGSELQGPVHNHP